MQSGKKFMETSSVRKYIASLRCMRILVLLHLT